QKSPQSMTLLYSIGDEKSSQADERNDKDLLLERRGVECQLQDSVCQSQRDQWCAGVGRVLYRCRNRQAGELDSAPGKDSLCRLFGVAGQQDAPDHFHSEKWFSECCVARRGQQKTDMGY